jgi:pimeloyl-ACP methyl ester carboxylesterase
MQDTVANYQLSTQFWKWQGRSVRYQWMGDQGPAVVLIHGFGASSDHWLKTLPGLAEHCRVYAIDLVGFGFSAKPHPETEFSYCFESWALQIIDFAEQVVGDSVFLVGNSIGCIAALQAAVMAPSAITGVALLNCSLRLLHECKRMTLPWYRQLFVPLVQQVLGHAAIGHWFFARLARPGVIRKILLEAYGRPEAVTDTLINHILAPAREPGAADVFLAFIRYSSGPIAEDLLPQVACPVYILWGEADPWEPVALGREFASFSTVKAFVTLPGVGHCPQDEAPEQVNPLLQHWINGDVAS